MEQYDFDAYVPAKMAARVEKAGITKGNMDFISMLTQAVLAGSFIGLGAVFFTYVIHDSALSTGLTKLIGGFVFSLGLILVIITGAELFTGNNLIVMAFISRKISFSQLLRNWATVFSGNLIGSLIIVFLIYLSGQWLAGNVAVGYKALMIANGKVNLTFWQALSRGILCNILVCLAVYLCFSGRSVTDKILAIIFPITAFVALGFEHSIANMYFIPAGLLLKNIPQVLTAAAELGNTAPDLTNLTVYGFLVNNLLPVTLGNIIGGTVFVGLAHWFLFLRTPAAESIRSIIHKGPPRILTGTTVAWALEVMKEKDSETIIVGEPGNSIGMITYKEIVRNIVEPGKDPAQIKVEQIMATPIPSADIKTPIYDIYRIMADKQLPVILILEGQAQLGFVSSKDIIANPPS